MINADAKTHPPAEKEKEKEKEADRAAPAPKPKPKRARKAPAAEVADSPRPKPVAGTAAGQAAEAPARGSARSGRMIVARMPEEVYYCLHILLGVNRNIDKKDVELVRVE